MTRRKRSGARKFDEDITRAVERWGKPHIIWGARALGGPRGLLETKKRKREEKEKQEGKNKKNEREKKLKKGKKINDREKSPSQNKIIPINW